jgi:sugar lactone lactonase YvrE
MTISAELILDAHATLGEGALWDSRNQRLLWVDILGKKLHLFDPSTRQDRAIDIGQFIGTVVPRRSGGVMVAVYDGFAALDPDADNVKLDFIADPEADSPDTRFNDGKCDPAGRFWAGTMSLKGVAQAGSLYVLNTDHTVRRMLTGVTTSNGIVWTADARTMYYIDTRLKRVDAFDYDLATGNIANRRTVITVPPEDGRPDGMTIDAEDKLWVAHWEGGRVTRWDPTTGALLQTIRVPVARVTSCAFGGPDLDTLYITTAQPAEPDPAQPHAGGLFVARPGVKGVPAVEYGG